MACPPTDTPLTKVPDEVWQTARERERVIRTLVQQPVLYGARSEVMVAAANELGITLQYLYRGVRPGSGPALPVSDATRTIDAEFQVITEDGDDAPLDLPFYEAEEWDD